MKKRTDEQNSIRIGNSVEAIKQAFLDNLAYVQGKFARVATSNDYYMALAYTVRDRLMAYWSKTAQGYLEKQVRTVCYFSAEYLLGPHLLNNLYNLGIYENLSLAIDELGLNLEELIEKEPEPGLGNGGLGRLAACYMDSMATLNIPAIGYGVRYEFGIFSQEIYDGWQVEKTDKWLRLGNPWEIPRPEVAFDIKFGGHTQHYIDDAGKLQVQWIPEKVVKGIAYDTPILGYKSDAANFVRLWKAEACESFDLQAFNTGDYWGAVNAKIDSENITKVLYPNDEPLVGRILRLQQQYFFVSSSLQDMIRIFHQNKADLENFSDKYVVQLNDTHPSIGVAELMRLLIDDNKMDWDKAWDITKKTFCYTNHTVMSEALEKWPVSLFSSILPRHYEILLEINKRFLESVRAKYPGDESRVQRMSFIDEAGERNVRMTNIACVGSQKINGVSGLHTDLLKRDVLRDFYEFYPEKFVNVTNGITPRRFLLETNPRLARLISEVIGDAWIKDLGELKKLEKYALDKKFQNEWQQVKHENKAELAKVIKTKLGVEVDADSLFDVQAKRFHEYKRQHLNILHAITLYNRIRRNPEIAIIPRTFIFAGKAAPGYFIAKLIIKLINEMAKLINDDPVVKGRLKIIFLPNFNVKNSRLLYPAAELSEQISGAGKEASGTGNMKFSLNGALTVGTLDGANVEMREEFGEENFFLFGLTHEEVLKKKSSGYDPIAVMNNDAELFDAIELIRNNEMFKPLIDNLLYRDEYLVFADYRSYIDTQDLISRTYGDKSLWTKMSILNVARIGKFSSDRAVKEYAEKIWKVEQVKS